LGDTGVPVPPKVGACDALPEAGVWQEITPPGVAISDGLTLDPINIGTVWLGADPQGGAGGLFKSTDCGASWTHVNTGQNGSTVDGGRIWSLAIDPVQQGVIYVVGAYGPEGLWKSTNGGVDWVQLFPPTSMFAQTVQYAFASNVSMDPHDHLHLVVGTHAPCMGNYAPVCQAESLDGGNTWNIVKIPNPTGSWVERTGPYAIDPTSWLYATEFNGMYLTTDNGASFTDVTPMGVKGATGGEFTTHPLSLSPMGNYYIPSFGPGGLLTSKDGRSWSVVPGVPSGQEQCVTVGNGKVYIADFGDGSYHVAAESNLSQWSNFPSPFAVAGGKQGPIYLSYDEAHKVLYSSNFTGGTWRVVPP
jgi:hypothetical protein